MKTGWPEIFPLPSLSPHLHKDNVDVEVKDSKYLSFKSGGHLLFCLFFFFLQIAVTPQSEEEE